MAEPIDARVAPRVILLEDDPLVRFAQEILLKDWGYRVVAESSRAGALAAIQDTPDDIAAIVADYHLGVDDNGAAVAQAIAAVAQREIPTIIMSASLGQRQEQTAREHGFDCFSKPVNPEHLRNWLSSVIA